MLPVPHGDDHRRVAVDPLVDAFRLDHQPGGIPYQTKVFGGHDPGGLLERPRCHETLDPRHRRGARWTSALGALIDLRLEQAGEIHDEVARLPGIAVLLAFAFLCTNTHCVRVS